MSGVVERLPVVVAHNKARGLFLDGTKAMWGQARQLALVLVYLQAVQWDQGMPPPLVAHCKRDMTPCTLSA